MFIYLFVFFRKRFRSKHSHYKDGHSYVTSGEFSLDPIKDHSLLEQDEENGEHVGMYTTLCVFVCLYPSLIQPSLSLCLCLSLSLSSQNNLELAPPTVVLAMVTMVQRQLPLAPLKVKGDSWTIPTHQGNYNVSLHAWTVEETVS